MKSVGGSIVQLLGKRVTCDFRGRLEVKQINLQSDLGVGFKSMMICNDDALSSVTSLCRPI